MVEYKYIEYDRCVVVEEIKIAKEVMDRCIETSTCFEFAGTVMGEGKKGVIYMRISDYMKAELENI